MSALQIFTGGNQGRIGLSIRGSVNEPRQITHLEQALQQLLEVRSPDIWVDCRLLNSLSSPGQRLLLQMDRRARGAGIQIHWCGMPTDLATHLRETGLAEVLCLEPAANYQGPAALLEPEVPVSSRIMPFQLK